MGLERMLGLELSLELVTENDLEENWFLLKGEAGVAGGFWTVIKHIHRCMSENPCKFIKYFIVDIIVDNLLRENSLQCLYSVGLGSLFSPRIKQNLQFTLLPQTSYFRNKMIQIQSLGQAPPALTNLS